MCIFNVVSTHRERLKYIPKIYLINIIYNNHGAVSDSNMSTIA